MKRFLCLLLSIVILLPLPIRAEAHTADLTPAIPIIRNQTKLYKHGLTETSVEFTSQDFRGLLGEDASHITIVSLPVGGILTYQDLAVDKGQSIPLRDVSLLRFTPATKEELCVSFVFNATGERDDKALECVISLRDSSAEFSTEEKTFSTYRDVCRELPLCEEASTQKILVTSAPNHGILSLDQKSCVYYPQTGFQGKDHFRYRILDSSGAVSEELQVNLRVEEPYQDVFFSDLKNSPHHYAAIDFVKYTDFPISKDENGQYLFEQDALISLTEVKEMLAAILEREQYYQEVFEGEGTELTEAILNEIACDNKEQTTRIEAALAISKALVQTKEAEQGLWERIIQWFS